MLVVAFVPAIWMNSKVELTYNLDSALPEDLPSLVAADKMATEFDRGQTFFIVAEDTGNDSRHRRTHESRSKRSTACRA